MRESNKEYAIVDRRLPMTVATAYIAVRKPTSDVGRVHRNDTCPRQMWTSV